MSDELIIKKFISRKLYRHKMWMHKHTNINNLPKGLPNTLRSSKDVRKAIDELLKQELVLIRERVYNSFEK